MAYGFNEDRSKVEIYSADQIDAMDLVNDEALAQEIADRREVVTAEASARSAGDSALDARISNIIAQGQSTEGNTELIDIRTGYDGVVSQTAGDAVRKIASSIQGEYRAYIASAGYFHVMKNDGEDFIRFCPVSRYSLAFSNIVIAKHSATFTITEAILKNTLNWDDYNGLPMFYLEPGYDLIYRIKTDTIEKKTRYAGMPEDGILLLEADYSNFSGNGLLGSLMLCSCALSSNSLLYDGFGWLHYGNENTRFVFMDNPRDYVKPDGATGGNNSIAWKLGGNIDFSRPGINAVSYPQSKFMEDMENAGVIYTDSSGDKWVAIPAFKLLVYSIRTNSFNIVTLNKDKILVPSGCIIMLAFGDKQCIGGCMMPKFILDMELHTLRNVASTPLAYSMDVGKGLANRLVGFRFYIEYNKKFVFPTLKDDLIYNERIKWKLDNKICILYSAYQWNFTFNDVLTALGENGTYTDDNGVTWACMEPNTKIVFNMSTLSLVYCPVTQNTSMPTILEHRYNQVIYQGLAGPKFNSDLNQQYNDVNSDSIISLNKGIVNAMRSLKRPKNIGNQGYLTEPEVLSLLHFSDPHNTAANLARIQQFKDYYSSLLNDAICTGDLVNGTFSDGIAYWSNCDGSILTCIGNHDSVYAGGWDDMVSEQDLYETFIEPYKDNWGTNAVTEVNKTYYYKDYPSCNVRLVVIDGTLRDASSQAAQISWLISSMNDAKTLGYTVVGAVHFPPVDGVKIDCNMCSSYRSMPGDLSQYAWGTYCDTVLSAVQSFIDNGGSFACWLSGHTHYDLVSYSRNYPRQLFITVTTAFTSDWHEDSPRVNGEKSQDAFNIIGIDTSSHILKIVRIGSDRDSLMRHKGVLVMDYTTSPATVLYEE